MKNVKRMLVLCTAFLMAVVMTACGGSDNGEKEKAAEETKPQVKEVELTNTYTTRFAEVNAITYPAFSFDYPDNWSVAEEEVTQTGETVVLSDGEGAQVRFTFMGNVAEGQMSGGSSVNMWRVDVSKAAESKFIPGAVQATDHSDLGKFMVAKLKVTGQMDTTSDTEFADVDGSVSYALLPESWIGTKDDVNKALYADFAFWYSGYISVIGDKPDGEFTPQEEKEVQMIIGSFRTAE